MRPSLVHGLGLLTARALPAGATMLLGGSVFSHDSSGANPQPGALGSIYWCTRDLYVGWMQAE